MSGTTLFEYMCYYLFGFFSIFSGKYFLESRLLIAGSQVGIAGFGLGIDGFSGCF